MDNLNETDYIYRSVLLKNHIEDGISSLNLDDDSANKILRDYDVYRSVILNCNELQHFLLVKFTKDVVAMHYNDYLIQADTDTYEFMDYLIGLSFHGSTLHNVSDYNKTLITNLFKRRVQWTQIKKK